MDNHTNAVPKNKKRLRCRLGLHSWYIDSAMFSSAERCNYCPATTDEFALGKLNKERELWDESKDLPFEEAQKIVAKEILFFVPPSTYPV